MNNIDKIIEIIHQLREEGSSFGGMTTQSFTGNPGFSASAEDPVAGTDLLTKFKNKKKKKIIDFRKVPKDYKTWVRSIKNK